ncbi:MAG: hypothetical protein ACI35R_06630 [Bacillus sp. (in: firmicutes)]
MKSKGSEAGRDSDSAITFRRKKDCGENILFSTIFFILAAPKEEEINFSLKGFLYLFLKIVEFLI